MNFINWIKSFGIKVLSKIEDRFAMVVASAFVIIIGALCLFFWDWIKTKHSLELHGWMWLILSTVFVGLVSHFLCVVLKYAGKIKNPSDVKGAITEWINNGGYIYFEVEKDRQYSFSNVDKELNIRRGSSQKYLPFIANKGGYGIQTYEKTFILTKLTDNNKILKLLETMSIEDQKQVECDCKETANKIGWPVEAVIDFFEQIIQIPEKFKVKVERSGKQKFTIDFLN